MEAFITALMTSVTGSALWGALAPVAPFIGVGILFGLGYMVVRKSSRGISKGKTAL